MGHGPRGINAVAREAAANLIKDSTRCHRAQALKRHRRFAPCEQELDRARVGKLRRRAPATVDRVERQRQPLDSFGQQRGVERLRACFQPCRARKPLQPGLGLLGDLLAALLPCLGDRGQNLRPGSHSLPRLRRKVGAAVEGELGGGKEDVQRPAALAGHRLHRLHVDRVDVGPLLAVHFDADEVLVHQRGDLGVLKAFALHHVAPVAGRIADRNEQRPVQLARARQRLVAPRQPINWVLSVLE